MDTNKYYKQAEDFLAQHGIAFSFVRQGEEDSAHCKGKKNYVFRFTFSRVGKRGFSDIFHGSVAQWEDAQGCKRVRGALVWQKPIPAKLHAYDVLSCLTKNDPGMFLDWCDECGYDTDSRKALATYEAVCEEWREVRAFFTKEETEELQEIN